MKKRLVVLSVFFLFFGVLGNAHALNFTLGSYNITLNNSDPGLVIQQSNALSPLPHNFDLALGIPQQVGLFNIWTDEGTVNDVEDTDPKDIAVQLNFIAPAGISGGPINGDTFGVRILGGLFQKGRVEWDGPATFNFGSGGSLLAWLSDETFNKGFLGLGCEGATINLSIKI